MNERPIFATTNGAITGGNQAKPNLGEPEDRLLGRDDDVANRDQSGPAAERGAVHATDHRHWQAIQRLEHPRHLGGVVHVLIVR